MNSIIKALERNASLQPDIDAVCGTDLILSWRQLRAETATCASQLAGSSVVGLHLANSPAWIVADLAAMAGGVAVVPLPGFFSDSQLRHAIRSARVDTVVTDAPWRIGSLERITREAEICIAGRRFAMLSLFPGRNRNTTPGPAMVTYTSGSTGEPKGVRLSMTAIESVAGSLAEATGAGPEDRALVVLPLSVLLENIGSVMVPILAGAKMLVPDPTELGLTGSSQVDPERFATMLDRYRPTTVILPPRLLKLLVDIARRGQLHNAFRFIAAGSAPVGEALLTAAQDLGLPIFQGYGLTEACSVVAVNCPAGNRLGSVGRPLPHARVRVGADGRIFVSGATCDGYIGAETLPAGSEIDTGDVGYVDEDGYLYVRGRSRNLIVTGYGRNISPEWVEAELTASEHIAAATVFGEAEDVLVAVVVPAGHTTAADLDVVMREVNRRLPDYARLDRFVVARTPMGPRAPISRAAPLQANPNGSRPGS